MAFLGDILEFFEFFADKPYFKFFFSVPLAFGLIYVLFYVLGWCDNE